MRTHGWNTRRFPDVCAASNCGNATFPIPRGSKASLTLWPRAAFPRWAPGPRRGGVDQGGIRHPDGRDVSSRILRHLRPSAWEICGYGGWIYSPDYYPSGEVLFSPGSSSNPGGYDSTEMNALISATTTDGDLALTANDPTYHTSFAQWLRRTCRSCGSRRQRASSRWPSHSWRAGSEPAWRLQSGVHHGDLVGHAVRGSIPQRRAPLPHSVGGGLVALRTGNARARVSHPPSGPDVEFALCGRGARGRGCGRHRPPAPLGRRCTVEIEPTTLAERSLALQCWFVACTEASVLASMGHGRSARHLPRSDGSSARRINHANLHRTAKRAPTPSATREQRQVTIKPVTSRRNRLRACRADLRQCLSRSMVERVERGRSCGVQGSPF